MGERLVFVGAACWQALRNAENCRQGRWGAGKVPTRNDIYENLGVPCPKALPDEARLIASAEAAHFKLHMRAGVSDVIPPPSDQSDG